MTSEDDSQKDIKKNMISEGELLEGLCDEIVDAIAITADHNREREDRGQAVEWRGLEFGPDGMPIIPHDNLVMEEIKDEKEIVEFMENYKLSSLLEMDKRLKNAILVITCWILIL